MHYMGYLYLLGFQCGPSSLGILMFPVKMPWEVKVGH